jgi:NAD(P)-dependent dehydrogenase (short-subunit alcohol dehydrogenase family)
MTPGSTGAVVVIADDGLGVAQRVAHGLADRGWHAVVAGLGSTAPVSHIERLRVDLMDPDAVLREVQGLRSRAGPVTGLLHLVSLGGGPEVDQVDLRGWRLALAHQVKSLFHLARAVHDDLRARPDAWLLAVTALGGDPATATASGSGGVAGLSRTLAAEWPETAVRLLHLDPTMRHRTDEAAVAVLAEVERMTVRGGREDIEIAAHEGLRLRPAMTAAPVAAADPLPLGPDSVVLLTGGARGITAQVALEIAQRHHPTLVLVGRSAPPASTESIETSRHVDAWSLRTALVRSAQLAGGQVTPSAIETEVSHILVEREIRATLALLRGTGARVEYLTADLREASQVDAVLRRVREKFARLDGVVHGAGVLDDCLVHEKSPESFDHVFDTKVDSAFALIRALDPISLRFLVFFSSVAGRFGNAGQADYAAANEVLCCLARDLNTRWPTRVTAMCWGPWSSGGMVTPALEQRFRDRGIEPLSPALGRRLFIEELAAGDDADAVVVLGRGPWGVRGGRLAVTAIPLRLRQPGTADHPALVETSLDPAEDGYLRDHVLDGRPVLPAAVAAEMMMEAAELAHPGRAAVELDDLVLLRGVVLRDGPAELLISVEPGETDPEGTMSSAVTLQVDDAGRPAYRGRIRLYDGLSASLPPLAPAVPGGSGPPAPPVPSRPFYGDLLFHGPVFQGVDGIDADGPNWVATVHGVTPVEFTTRSPGGEWLLDPSLLDLGPQLSILWARAAFGTTTLPVRFATVRRGVSVRHVGSLRTVFRAREGADPSWVVADLDVLNPDGSVRLSVTGLEAAGSAALNRLATAGAVT